ncbi:MAG: tetratricopeptide repeat protein, partial [Deltaproteobacteria bacterium]|nr:tetratricopeptide repeat protein [Deltaproteobacteria bacterium]
MSSGPGRWTATVFAAAMLAMTASTATAQAQQPPTARERAQARTAFQRGERAFDEGRTEEALDDFRRAFRLAPHDAVRFNIAVCLERLGRFIEAAQEYDAASVSEALDAPTQQRAREQAARVRLSTALLIVSGSPAGADVLVDDERRCALPCRVRVDPGARRIVVRSAGGEATRSVTVARGAEARVRLDVSARPTGG